MFGPSTVLSAENKSPHSASRVDRRIDVGALFHAKVGKMKTRPEQ